MRIALLLGSGNPSFGGVERHVIQLANGLIASGHEAFVIMGHPCPIDADHGLRPEVQQIRVPVPDGRSFPSYARAGLRHLLARRPCILHTHLTYALGLGVIARSLLGLPLVHTEHFLVRKSGDQGVRGGLGALLRARTDALVFVSRMVREGCRVAGSRPSRHVIYNGVAPPPGPAERRPPTSMLYVGRLEPDKHVELALDVVRALRTERYTLDIVGTGSLATALQHQAADLVTEGLVRFHGWQRDVGPFFTRAGVLLQPAREGLGYSAIEAAAHGVAILAPADSGAAEVIALSGDGTAIDAGGRIEAWVDAIRALDVPRKRMGALPPEFHLSHMLDATTAVYQSLWQRYQRAA